MSLHFAGISHAASTIHVPTADSRLRIAKPAAQLESVEMVTDLPGRGVGKRVSTTVLNSVSI